jgi:hypothetical protein
MKFATDRPYANPEAPLRIAVAINISLRGLEP